MATSPNYSWPEPDNTDLVKNGALAIRTMGNAIDTTMATMTPKSTYTAKGSIAAATGASTPANLSVGNNGETLVADSSTSTGLRYQAPVQQNPVLNSAFQVWQRGTSFTPTTTSYSADRWQAYRGTTGSTVSRQVTGDTTNLPNIQYCARVSRDSGNTNTSDIYLTQAFESVNSIPFAGKTVTFSFYARKGANFSAAGINATLYTGTGTDQNVLTGYTGSVTAIGQSQVLSTTWTRYQFTATLASTATELQILFGFTPVGTAGAADYYEVTGIQLEVGSVATPFKTYAGTLQGELSACQRYYFRTVANGSYSTIARGIANSGTAGVYDCVVPVQMRVFPTSIDFSTLGVTLGASNSIYSVSAATLNGVIGSLTSVGVSITNSASGFTNGQTNIISTNGSSAGYLGFSAEL